MTCTTMSPQSTSTHSPRSSPSTPMIGAPGRLQLVADVLRERVHLPVGFGGGDDQRVVQAGELADIEYGDVAGLDVFEGGDGGFLQAIKAHPLVGRYSWLRSIYARTGAGSKPATSARPAAPRGERGADRGGRNRLRRHRHGARSSRRAAAQGATGRSSAAAPIARAALAAAPRVERRHPGARPRPDGRA